MNEETGGGLQIGPARKFWALTFDELVRGDITLGQAHVRLGDIARKLGAHSADVLKAEVTPPREDRHRAAILRHVCNPGGSAAHNDVCHTIMNACDDGVPIMTPADLNEIIRHETGAVFHQGWRDAIDRLEVRRRRRKDALWVRAVAAVEGARGDG